MNYKMMGKFLSLILFLEAFFMLPALFISLYCGDHMATKGFLVALAAAAVPATVLYFICRSAPSAFYATEGFVCVALSWIVMSLVGCLPFCISGEIPGFVDAFFEMVSGFTTTGASVLNDVEALSHASLFWRSFSHWIGGMGVLVFIIATVKLASGGGNIYLLRAESPGV